MQCLYRSLLLAEQNLSSALNQRDVSRALLVNDALFQWSARLNEIGVASNPCSEALQGLTGAAVAAGFWVHPIVTDDPFNRFSDTMRPSDETLAKWFEAGSAAYRGAMPSCEEAIRAPVTSRVLPPTLTQTR